MAIEKSDTALAADQNVLRSDTALAADQNMMDEKHDDLPLTDGSATPPIDQTLIENHDEALHGQRHQFAGMNGGKLGVLISVIATTGFLLFGYDQGVMSGIIGAVPFNTYFPETKGDSVYQGFVTAIYEVGCLVGALAALFWGDTVGRRKMIMGGGVIMIVGVLIQVTAFKGHKATAQFIIGRTITGVGNGMNTSTIPTYQAECSRTTNRGLLICIEGGIIAVGTMIAYWIDFGCSYSTDADLTWRFPIAFQIFFGIILVAGTVFLPESPRWLLSIDRTEDATKVLSALNGLGDTHPQTILEREVIMDSIMASGGKNGKAPFSALLTNGKTQHFRRMILGSSSQLMQQLGGCNAAIYYFPILMQTTLNQTENMALLLGGVNMVVYAIFATTSWFIIEYAGRRKLFLIGSLGQALSMILVFACLIPDTTSAGNGAVVGLFTYIAFFGATWLPLPWLYPAEINPIRTRGRANAVSTSVNWISNFMIVMVVPVMLDSIGFGTYVFFAGMNLIFIPFIYFFYPETKKRSLEEIDLIFAKGYVENMSYVKASFELPYLTEREIEQAARHYGFVNGDDEEGDPSDEVPGGFSTLKRTKSSDESILERSRKNKEERHENILNELDADQPDNSKM